MNYNMFEDSEKYYMDEAPFIERYIHFGWNRIMNIEDEKKAEEEFNNFYQNICLYHEANDPRPKYMKENRELNNMINVFNLSEELEKLRILESKKRCYYCGHTIDPRKIKKARKFDESSDSFKNYFYCNDECYKKDDMIIYNNL